MGKYKFKKEFIRGDPFIEVSNENNQKPLIQQNTIVELTSQYLTHYTVRSYPADYSDKFKIKYCTWLTNSYGVVENIFCLFFRTE